MPQPLGKFIKIYNEIINLDQVISIKQRPSQNGKLTWDLIIQTTCCETIEFKEFPEKEIHALFDGIQVICGI